MKKPLRILLISFVLLPLTAWADTYVLKNGDKVEGTLIRETETSYILEVYLAPTIKDEQEVLIKDVVRVLKPEVDLAKFNQLRDLVPVPDGLKAGDYKQRIELLTQFIETYPSSSKVRKAMEIRVDLRDEMRQVEDGAVKIAGVLYPAIELRENAYELDARIEARRIKGLASNRKHLQALRAYLEFQKEYTYTKVHLDMIPLMQKLIAVHRSQAIEWLDSLEMRLEDRAKGLQSMNLSDRRDSERAIQDEEDKLSRLYRTETASNVGWVTLHPFSKQSLDYTIQYSRTELRKIDTLLSRDFTDGGALFRELHKLKQQGAEDRVMREKMREAQHLKIPMRYLEKFALAGRR